MNRKTFTITITDVIADEQNPVISITTENVNINDANLLAALNNMVGNIKGSIVDVTTRTELLTAFESGRKLTQDSWEKEDWEDWYRFTKNK